MILYPAACNNTNRYPRAHLCTVCTYTQHRQETRGQPQLNTGRERCLYWLLCQHRSYAPELQLQPLPSLRLAWRGVLLRGVHPLAIRVSGSCCETGRALSGIQPVSPSCWPLDPQVPKTCGPAPVAPTYSCWPTRGLVPPEVC